MPDTPGSDVMSSLPFVLEIRHFLPLSPATRSWKMAFGLHAEKIGNYFSVDCQKSHRLCFFIMAKERGSIHRPALLRMMRFR
jgi:hypothetical protein